GFPAPLDLRFGQLDHLLTGSRRVLPAFGVGAYRRGGVRVAQALGDLPALLLDASQLLHPDLVDLARIERQGGEGSNLAGVDGIPARQVAKPDAAPCRGPVVTNRLQVATVGRPDLVPQH